jgi:hypothetical protein
MARVIVYKNLKRGDWSIADTAGRNGLGRGRLIGHRSSVTLANVTLYVQESARQRVIRTKAREVHAWGIGDIVDAAPASMASREITYNPYRSATFHDRAGNPVTRADFVEFTAQHGAIAHNV